LPTSSRPFTAPTAGGLALALVALCLLPGNALARSPIYSTYPGDFWGGESLSPLQEQTRQAQAIFVGRLLAVQVIASEPPAPPALVKAVEMPAAAPDLIRIGTLGDTTLGAGQPDAVDTSLLLEALRAGRPEELDALGTAEDAWLDSAWEGEPWDGDDAWLAAAPDDDLWPPELSYEASIQPTLLVLTLLPLDKLQGEVSLGLPIQVYFYTQDSALWQRALDAHLGHHYVVFMDQAETGFASLSGDPKGSLLEADGALIEQVRTIILSTNISLNNPYFY